MSTRTAGGRFGQAATIFASSGGSSGGSSAASASDFASVVLEISVFPDDSLDRSSPTGLNRRSVGSNEFFHALASERSPYSRDIPID
jgi:hypothetical protein